MVDGGEEQAGSQGPTPTLQEKFKPEYPSHFTLYRDVLDELKKRVADYKARKLPLDPSDKKPTLLREEDEVRFFHFPQGEEAKMPLDLPTVGSDQAIPHSISFNKINTSEGSPDNHDFIKLEFKLFKNGDSHMIEGDEKHYFSNEYSVLLGREMEPVIAQHSQIGEVGGFGNITRESYSDANKQKLTDQECERILDAIKSLGDPTFIGLTSGSK